MNTLHCAPISHSKKNDLAAILFTSGSTGRPKGVQLSLNNLQHFIDWSTQSLSLSKQDRFLNIASFNFDISTFDLFSSLSVGGSLYVAKDDAAKQPLNLATILKEQKISI
ncbi:AMP-binding protein, partial [Pseudoalteromonas ruthenica]|uniref:AMP-binding protein n=1 Tax=Pseudoalteromonas ruthenica TaxID=151081 RepID=UPI003211C180